MICGFFDESGEHASKANGGRLLKLTVGGCLAPYDKWEALSADWGTALLKMGIPMFHMAAFENKNRPFCCWDDDQRKSRLNLLLDLIGDCKPYCFGFTNEVRHGEKVEAIYERCASDVMTFLCNAEIEDETMLTFAHHPEFGRQSPLYKLINSYTLNSRVKRVDVAHPIDTCPLQVADIVAYEVKQTQRNQQRPERYPMKRLCNLGCLFRISAEA
jgi:hypothetical protein